MIAISVGSVDTVSSDSKLQVPDQSACPSKCWIPSDRRWVGDSCVSAHDSGYFMEEMAPVTVKIKGKEVVVDVDEHPRPQTTLEGLAKLPTVFKKDGVVTAGSSSVSVTNSRCICTIISVCYPLTYLVFPGNL